MTELRKNKTAQFISGCFALFCLWNLYEIGFFDRFFNRDAPEGYESATLITLALTAVFDTVCMLGIFTMVLGGYIATYAIDLLSAGFDLLRKKAVEISERLPKPEEDRSPQLRIDAVKLDAFLGELVKRLENLEGDQEAKPSA